ncbi:MAG: hypothetical protein O7B99_11995, partial [Planctomycetota bacterium]|nr:hypothetical protein [Planctomycetota bacterium]
MAAVPFALLAAHFSFVCDDAYIVFRYARNLAAGLGLRYNLGVEPPVEGYTQLGWVLWISLFERLGWDPVFWSRATSITCGAGLLLAIASVARRRFGPGLLPVMAATLFFAVLPWVSVWTTGGLETMAFTLATFGVFERLLGDPERSHPRQAVACGLLACLLRADGVWWVLAVLAAAFDETRRGRSRASSHATPLASPYAILGCAALVLSGFALLEAFRIGYHGDWLPNTARVKVGFSALALQRGAYYVLGSWLTVPAVLVLPLHALWLDLRRTVPLARPCLVVVASTWIYAVLVGGDFMAMGRLLVPSAPFLALLAAGVAGRLTANARPLRAALAGAALLVLTVPASFDL